MTLNALTASSLQKIIHPDDFEEILGRWNKHVADKNKDTFYGECRYRRHDGMYRWFEVRTASVKDADGNILAYHGTSSDVDDFVVKRREAERHTEQIMRGLQHGNVQVSAYDADFRLLVAVSTIKPRTDSHNN